MNDLEALANAYGTDKGSKNTRITKHHRYTDLYYLLLNHQRHAPLVVIEVGAQAVGGPEQNADWAPISDLPSARMWAEFLPHAEIHVIDIRPLADGVALPASVHFHQADSGDRATFEALVGALPNAADLIIDDGSHASLHQLNTLLSLWERLKPGGTYIVEDLHWQPDAVEEAHPHHKFTQFLDEGYDAPLSPFEQVRCARIRQEASYAAYFPSFVPERPCERKVLVLQKAPVAEDALTICAAFDSAHAEPALISLTSYHRRAGVACRFVLCVDETVSEAMLEPFYTLLPDLTVTRVTTAQVAETYLQSTSSFHGTFNAAVFYRFELFASPHLSGRCLYVDTDTLCLAPLGELLQISLDEAGALLAACSVGRSMTEQYVALELAHPYAYFNAGVLLFDAQTMRAAMTPARAADLLRENGSKYYYADQCLLNHAARGRVHWLDKRYNLVSWMHDGKKTPANPFSTSDSFHPERIQETAAIVHFAGARKPWDASASVAAWTRAAWDDAAAACYSALATSREKEDRR
ncbi:MAG: glycosyltransferase [Pseudomonadota bacterium]